MESYTNPMVIQVWVTNNKLATDTEESIRLEQGYLDYLNSLPNVQDQTDINGMDQIAQIHQRLELLQSDLSGYLRNVKESYKEILKRGIL